MKKVILYCMLLGMLLLIGCNSNSNKGKENDTSTFAEVPNEDRTFYCTASNWNSDIHVMDTFTPHKEFSIISLEPLDMNSIEIEVPIKTDYAVEMVTVDREDIRMTDYTASDRYKGSTLLFKYYVYQSYRGIDWKKMRELHDKAKEAETLFSQGSIGYEEYKKISEEYTNYQNLYLEDYKALTEEDLPIYYVYIFRINFGAKATSYDEYGFAKATEFSKNIVSETFQTIDIQIGDKTYTQEIGEVRLYKEDYPEHFKDSTADYMKVNSFPIGLSKPPFGDGIMRMSEMKFVAEEDLTLTKLYLYETNTTPLTAKVIISDDNGNILVDIQWDLKSPIPIEKGQQVSVCPIVQDKNAIQLEYGARCCAVIDYTVGSETYSFYSVQRMDTLPDVDNGLWIRYAATFWNLEEPLRDYFTYYYPVFEEWREWLGEV